MVGESSGSREEGVVWERIISSVTGMVGESISNSEAEDGRLGSDGRGDEG